MNSEENEVSILHSLSVSQLWCAAGVNLSGGRIPELTKQTKGSQSSLDQLEQESKVRVSTLRKRLFLFSSVFCIIIMFEPELHFVGPMSSSKFASNSVEAVG